MLFKKRRKEEVAVGSPPVDQPASEPRTSNTNDDLKKEAQQEPTKDAATKPAAPEVQYPMGVKLFLIMFSLLVSMFLVAMVRNLSGRQKALMNTDERRLRTASSSPPRYPKSPTTSTPSPTLAGTAPPTS